MRIGGLSTQARTMPQLNRRSRTRCSRWVYRLGALHQAVMSEDTKAMLVNLTIKAITTETGVQTTWPLISAATWIHFGPPTSAWR